MSYVDNLQQISGLCFCQRYPHPRNVRCVAREMNVQYVPAQADMPLEYAPGTAIQIDWGKSTIYLRGERKLTRDFCGRLCYSCDIFAMAYLNQTTENFLESQ